MATINTVDDLIRVLDENPQWWEDLRAHFQARGDPEMPYLLSRLAARREERAAQRAETDNAP